MLKLHQFAIQVDMYLVELDQELWIQMQQEELNQECNNKIVLNHKRNNRIVILNHKCSHKDPQKILV